MMNDIQDLSPGGSISKIFGYDGTLDVAMRTMVTNSSSVDTINADVLGDRIAEICTDATAWEITVGSIAANTYGTPVTLSDVHSNSRPRIKLVNTNLLSVIYVNSSAQEWRLKTYTISGNTLSADQDIKLEDAASGSKMDCDIERMTTGGRMMAKYTTNAAYHRVSGFNASAGSLTKDASPATIVATASADGTEKRSSLAKHTTTIALLVYAVSSPNTNMRFVTLTDSGTAITVGTPVDMNNGFNRPCIAAGATCGIFLGAISTQFSYALPFLISAGTLGDKDWANDPSAGIIQVGKIMMDDAVKQQQNIVYLGDVDADGIEWFAMLAKLGASTELHLQFIGVDVTGGLARNIRTCIKRVATGVSSMQANQAKLVAISMNEIAIFVNTDPTLKYKIVKLA